MVGSRSCFEQQVELGRVHAGVAHESPPGRQASRTPTSGAGGLSTSGALPGCGEKRSEEGGIGQLPGVEQHVDIRRAGPPLVMGQGSKSTIRRQALRPPRASSSASKARR